MEPKTTKGQRQYTAELESRAFAVVDKFVYEEGRSFTAYDVTQAIRGETDVRVPHRHVKVAVEDIYEAGEMNGYTAAPDLTIEGNPTRYSPPQG